MLRSLSPRARRGMALMAIAVVGMVAASAYYLRPWVVVVKPQTVATYTVVRPTPDTHDEVQYEFLSAALVWAVVVEYSNDGNNAGSYRLYRSVDGARTWTREREGKTGAVWTTESSLRFVDPATGFLAVDDPLILRTTSDRGQSWKSVHLPAHANLMMTQFADASRGWLVAGQTDESWRLYSTDDGGATWTSLPDVPDDLLFQPQFRASGEGWAGSRNTDHPHLYSSRDGGRSWVAHDLPTPGGLTPDVRFTSVVRLVPGGAILASVQAVNLDTSTGDYSFKSSDGGVSWVPLVGPVDQPGLTFGCVFQDSTHWWLTADSNLYKTSDGGDTWVRSPGVVPADIFVSRVLDARHAWGQFYDDASIPDLGFTSDGGLHWTRLKAPGRK